MLDHAVTVILDVVSLVHIPIALYELPVGPTSASPLAACASQSAPEKT